MTIKVSPLGKKEAHGNLRDTAKDPRLEKKTT